MKRILALPKNENNGVLYIKDKVLNGEYVILDQVHELNMIQVLSTKMLALGKNPREFKYSIFRGDEVIPYLIKVRDCGNGGGFSEFECDRVKYSEIPIQEEERKKLIENKYLQEPRNKMKEIVQQVNYLMAMEKLGEKINEDDFINLGVEKNKIRGQIDEFNYQDHLQELI